MLIYGGATAKKLRSRAITTIGDLAHYDPKIIKLFLKSHGMLVWNYANGIECSPVRENRRPMIKGIGNSTTISFDVEDKGTLLSIGLGIEAIRQGYRVQFTSMDDVIHLLKTQEITRVSRSKLKRITSVDLVILDDLMFMAIDHHEANLFFQLINKLYGQTSIIITSKKGPEDWGEILGDPAITTAILDRLLHKSDLLNLVGDSYRLKHRQTIFGTSQSGVSIGSSSAAG